MANKTIKKELETQTSCGFLFSKPSFFKVLISDYSNKLKIPSTFAKKYLDNYAGKNRLNLATHRGSWAVEVVQSGDHGCLLEEGWAAFVRANELEFGDFLVFFLTGSCALSVVMYNKAACAKNLVELVERRSSLPERKKRVYHSDERLCYELCVTLKKYQRYNMWMQRAFMEESGLAQMTKIEIVNEEGRSWPVMVRGKRRFGAGWVRFWTENNLSPGNRCMFRCTWDTNKINLKIEFRKLDGKNGEAGTAKATPKDDPEHC
ncbi:hypothetical protein QQ045_031832 [Rhodiola kirilowii]